MTLNAQILKYVYRETVKTLVSLTIHAELMQNAVPRLTELSALAYPTTREIRMLDAMNMSACKTQIVQPTFNVSRKNVWIPATVLKMLTAMHKTIVEYVPVSLNSPVTHMVWNAPQLVKDSNTKLAN